MGMRTTVKVKFNASKESFEKFGNGMYLIYLPFEEEEDSWKIIAGLLSRKIGTPVGRIEFAGKDVKGNYVYEIV
jgi:hypothetical protein